MKEFEVNFVLSGQYWIDAENENKAREIVNEMIGEKIREIENFLHCGLEDDDYTTDVIEM